MFCKLFISQLFAIHFFAHFRKISQISFSQDFAIFSKMDFFSNFRKFWRCFANCSFRSFLQFRFSQVLAGFRKISQYFANRPFRSFSQFSFSQVFAKAICFSQLFAAFRKGHFADVYMRVPYVFGDYGIPRPSRPYGRPNTGRPLGAAHGGIMIITPGRLNLPVTRKLLRWAGEASGCRLPRQEGD